MLKSMNIHFKFNVLSDLKLELKQDSNTINRRSYMGAHVLLNLLKALGKSDKN